VSLAGGISTQLLWQAATAVMYGTASFLIVLVNKAVLTTHKFPSFQALGLGQIVATITILGVARATNVVSFPGPGRDTFGKIWPLPLFYIGESSWVDLEGGRGGQRL
jgi:solute carrier family 35 protein